MHVTTKSLLKNITNNTLYGHVNGIRGHQRIGDQRYHGGGIGGHISMTTIGILFIGMELHGGQGALMLLEMEAAQ